MWFRVSQFILRNRLAVLLGILAVTLFLGYFMLTNLSIENKYGSMLPNNVHEQKVYKRAEKIFGTDGNILIVGVRGDNLYEKDNFVAWYNLAEKIKKMDGVDSVLSEASIYQLVKDTSTKSFRVETLIKSEPNSQEEINGYKEITRANPFFKDFIFTEDEAMSLMMIQIQEEFLMDLKKGKVVNNIESEARALGLEDLKFAGLPYIRIVVGKMVVNELYMFVGLSAFITSLLLFLFFRSFKIVFVSLTVVVIAVIWALGSVGLFDFRLSALMSLIPPLMIVIGVPNSIFLINKYHQEVRTHKNKMKALSRAIEKVGKATFLTNLTTAMGFLTFLVTNSNKLMEFGFIAALNVLLLFVISITVIPIFLTFFDLPSTDKLNHLSRGWLKNLLLKFENWALYRRKWVYTATGLVIVISFWGISLVETTGNITGDLPPDNPIVQDLKFLEEDFNGVVPFNILIDFNKKGQLLTRKNLKKYEAISNHLVDQGIFAKPVGLAEGAKLLTMSFYGNDPAQYRLPKTRELPIMEEYLRSFLEGSEGQTSPFTDSTLKTTRILCQVRDYGSNEMLALVDSMKVGVNDILNPGYNTIESLIANKELNLTNTELIDSVFALNSKLKSGFEVLLAGEDESIIEKLDYGEITWKDLDPKGERLDLLNEAISNEKITFNITGAGPIAALGTSYLVKNLLTSLALAILIIAGMMALLFKNTKMVLTAMIPNLIPLLTTGGIMGLTGVPIKPSTILVFGIAFGISVDDTIHFLAKFKQELKHREWDLKYCVLRALQETGVSMVYTSIILFFGFGTFTFSQFGGTKALGMLVSFTLLIAMVTNLQLMPSLLLWLEKSITKKAHVEPLIELYDEEEDIDLDELEVKPNNHQEKS